MFLFEEQIKSQLVKEIRFYKDSIDELNETVSLFFTKTKNMNYKLLNSNFDIGQFSQSSQN